MGPIPFGQFYLILFSIPNFFPDFFCLIHFTMSLPFYSEYLLGVVYIPSRIAMEEIFLN